MMDKPATSQEDSRSEWTTPEPPPDSGPDASAEHDPSADAVTRPASHAWGTESATTISPAPSGDTPSEREPGSSPSEREAPSWFSRNREQRAPQSGDTGLPDKETSAATDWFSGRGDTTAFDPNPEDEAADSGAAVTDTVEDSPPAVGDANDPRPTRPIVMVRRTEKRGSLPRLAQVIGLPPTAIQSRPLGAILTVGAVLVLIALLANSVGLALTVVSAIVPLIMLAALVPFRDGQTSNATIMLGITTLNGVIVGGVIGWLAARLVASNWFDEGVLNFGAIGFGGHYAQAAGSAGWWVWLVCGLVIPIVALPAALIAPALAFRSGQFPDSANGTEQGAASGAGFAIGTATVFWAPLNVHEAPSFNTSDWTLMIIAVAFIMPAILVFATMLVGKGLWQWLRTNRVFPAALFVIAGIGGVMVLRLGSLVIQPRQAHLWLEFAWTVVIVLGMLGLTRWITRRPELPD